MTPVVEQSGLPFPLIVEPPFRVLKTSKVGEPHDSEISGDYLAVLWSIIPAMRAYGFLWTAKGVLA